MAKLYFRHGTVGSAKTLNLLAVAHNYRQQGKEILLVKPALDNRFGKQYIKSRAGLEKSADVLVDKDTDLTLINYDGIDCILVDEVQFLESKHLDQLREVSRDKNVPVICYGLRTDYKTHLFEGSKRLMELADSIEEIKTTCAFCNRKAIYNVRHVNGEAVLAGPVIELGADDKYFPACSSCYAEQVFSKVSLKKEQ